MDSSIALAAFAALSQPTRLAAFRLLAAAGPRGLPAGVVADRLGTVSSTLSHHLGLLERAGLVRARREGRFVYYTVDPDGARQLLAFVTELCGREAARRGPAFLAGSVAAR